MLLESQNIPVQCLCVHDNWHGRTANRAHCTAHIPWMERRLMEGAITMACESVLLLSSLPFQHQLHQVSGIRLHFACRLQPACCSTVNTVAQSSKLHGQEPRRRRSRSVHIRSYRLDRHRLFVKLGKFHAGRIEVACSCARLQVFAIVISVPGQVREEVEVSFAFAKNFLGANEQ
jgi:hypothetical protein